MTVTTETTLVDMVVALLLLPDTGTVNAKVGNIGNGTIESVRAAAPAVLGIYTATLLAPGAPGDPATTYAVADPAGTPLGEGTVGQGFMAAGFTMVMMPGTVAFAEGDAFAITLNAPTGAGKSVYSPRDWPAKTELYPMILVTWVDDDKESLGPNGPQYDTTSTIRVVARVATLAGKGDAGAHAALAAIGVLKRQIEVAVINRYVLYRIINEIGSVKSRPEVKAEGEGHIGEVVMDFAMKYPQLADVFAPVLTSPIREIAIYADLLDVADRSGTYTPPFDYAVVPAPRTQGPDGRPEGGALITIEP
jgi:hypothetical protein